MNRAPDGFQRKGVWPTGSSTREDERALSVASCTSPPPSSIGCIGESIGYGSAIWGFSGLGNVSDDVWSLPSDNVESGPGMGAASHGAGEPLAPQSARVSEVGRQADWRVTTLSDPIGDTVYARDPSAAAKLAMNDFSKLHVTSADGSKSTCMGLSETDKHWAGEMDGVDNKVFRQNSGGSTSSVSSGSNMSSNGLSVTIPPSRSGLCPFSAEFRHPMSMTTPRTDTNGSSSSSCGTVYEKGQAMWAPVPHRSVVEAIQADFPRTPSPAIEVLSTHSSPTRARSASQFSNISAPESYGCPQSRQTITYRTSGTHVAQTQADVSSHYSLSTRPMEGPHETRLYYLAGNASPSRVPVSATSSSSTVTSASGNAFGARYAGQGAPSVVHLSADVSYLAAGDWHRSTAQSATQHGLSREIDSLSGSDAQTWPATELLPTGRLKPERAYSTEEPSYPETCDENGLTHTGGIRNASCFEGAYDEERLFGSGQNQKNAIHQLRDPLCIGSQDAVTSLRRDRYSSQTRNRDNVETYVASTEACSDRQRSDNCTVSLTEVSYGASSHSTDISIPGHESCLMGTTCSGAQRPLSANYSIADYPHSSTTMHPMAFKPDCVTPIPQGANDMTHRQSITAVSDHSRKHGTNTSKVSGRYTGIDVVANALHPANPIVDEMRPQTTHAGKTRTGRRSRGATVGQVGGGNVRYTTPNVYGGNMIDPAFVEAMTAQGIDPRRAAAAAAAIMTLDSSTQCTGGSQLSTMRSALLEQFRASQSHGMADENGGEWALTDISGHIVEFSVDQHGSRFIQTKLEVASEEDVKWVLREILGDMNRLVTDVFGNYVIQKLLEHGTVESIQHLAERLRNRMLPLSLHMYGCRAVQKAIEVFPAPIQAELVAELDGHVLKCIRDQNGNHVIQKCIERVPAAYVQFIVDAVASQAVSLAEHSYGCRVIQRMLEHSSEQQKAPITKEIMLASRNLIRDQYGNYVIQHVVEHGKEDERCAIMKLVKQQCVALSRHKFASNVVERCLQHGSPADRLEIVELLIGGPGSPTNSPLIDLVQDQFGNYVVQRILDIACEAQRSRTVEVLRSHVATIKRYSYGKHILARIDASFVSNGTDGVSTLVTVNGSQRGLSRNDMKLNGGDNNTISHQRPKCRTGGAQRRRMATGARCE